jgi:hypothetical protein
MVSSPALFGSMGTTYSVPDQYPNLSYPDPTRLPAIVNKNNFYNTTLLTKSFHKGK